MGRPTSPLRSPLALRVTWLPAAAGGDVIDGPPESLTSGFFFYYLHLNAPTAP